MNKHLIVIGIIIILISVGFSGCTNNTNTDIDNLNPFSDKSKFIGSWEKFGLVIYQFFEDNTYKGTATEGTYELKDGKLICRATNFDITMSYHYSFSDDNKVLMLEGIGTNSYTLNKVE